MIKEYPKMMYIAGSKFEFEGKKLDSVIVKDKDEQELRLSEGWKLNPALEDVRDLEKENAELQAKLNMLEGKDNALRNEKEDTKEAKKEEVKDIAKSASKTEGNKLPKGIK